MAEPSTAGIENITQEFLSMIKLPDENGLKLNYLFVLPETATNHETAYAFPVGSASVCSALKASGRRVFTLNLNYKNDYKKWLRHMIESNNIDVMLTGGLSVQFDIVKNIIDMAKEIKPSIVAIVGGGIITADPITAMQAFETADYGVIGEGEITVNALAYALETKNDPAELDGIICERNGQWSVNENWPMIMNLDILPFPDLVGFEYHLLFDRANNFWAIDRVMDYRSTYVGYISMSRSCPFKCTFCFHTCGDKYRQKSMDIVFKELDWMFSLYPIDMLWSEDELSFSNREFALEFCRRIKPYNLYWKSTLRIDSVTEEILTAIKESGGVAISFGLESGDNRILKSMQKHITIEKTAKCLDICKKVGSISALGSLIFGDLEETMETFQNTVNWMRKYNRSAGIAFGLICAYPGSYLYKAALEKGIIKDPVQFLKDGCPPVNLSKMSDDEYNALPAILDILQTESNPETVPGTFTVEPLSDYTMHIHGICPHCLKHISYSHYEFVFNINPQACPVCGKPLVLNPVIHCDCEKMNDSIKSVIGEKGAAVWAVNHSNFYLLLEYLPALKSEQVLFINKNDIVIPHNRKTVQTLGGKKMFKPDVFDSELAKDIETVIVPNNPRAFYDIKAQCRAEFPNIKRIIHITELM